MNSLKKNEIEFFIGHLSDQLLLVSVEPRQTRIVAEKMMTIFRNRAFELQAEHANLRKEWGRMQIVVFSGRDLRKKDISYLESLYFRSSSKIKKKPKNNTAYKYHGRKAMPVICEV